MVGKENREAWGWLHTCQPQAPTPSLSCPHAVSGTGGEVSGGPAGTGVCVHVPTHAHAGHHAAGHTPTAPGTVPQR